jgi:transcription elongation factor Spt5
MQATFWNERYQNNETVYGLLPNVFFKHCIDKINTGKLLLPAEGEGRNAVYAAKNGWDVTAFDYSEVAKEKALKMAISHQVTFAYQTTDFLSFEAEPASMDAVALIYAHMPPEIRSEFHHKVAYWVKKGGYVILEATDRESAEEAAYDLPYVKGIIGKTVTYEEIKNMIEPKVEDIKIEVGDIVEMIGSTFKGEKAKVTRVDKQKGEAVVSLLGASVPIPVTVKLDNIKVIRREDSEQTQVDDKNKNVEEDDKEFKLSDEVDLI